MATDELAQIDLQCGCRITMTKSTYGFRNICLKHTKCNIQKILKSARLRMLRRY